MLVVKHLEPWARTHQQRWHAEALQMYGEKVIIRHRWNIRDYAEGRVHRCTECNTGTKINERQRVRVASGTSGNYSLELGVETTAPIAWDATPEQIQSALEDMPGNNPGDVIVTADFDGNMVEFRGQWAYSDDIPLMTYTADTGLVIEIVRVNTGLGDDISERTAAVYKQSGDSRCTACYGAGFEGGYEPIIYVTFALVQDQVQETTRGPGGAMQREEPNAQFSFEPAVEEFDIVARVKTWESDGVTPRQVRGRFVIGEVQPTTLRTGPGSPSDSIGLVPAKHAIPWEPPNRDWIIGQRAKITVVPWDHMENYVPLTKYEERTVLAGVVPERHWYDRTNTSTSTSPEGSH